MDKHQLMLDAFIENVQKNYQEDVGMVIVYGSYVTHTMNELSDVDIMFVGKTKRAFDLQKQFIYEGIGYDFFCMPIERVHKIVESYSPLISIIAEGKLLYADSLEKTSHFKALQTRLNQLPSLEPVTKYFSEIEKVMKTLKVLAFDHQFASFEKKIHIQGQMIYQAMHYLQLLNRKHYKYGIKKMMEEIQSMELKPKTIIYYLELLQKQSVSTLEIMTFVNTLEEFYQDIKKANQTAFDKDELNGFYEEESSVWNKLINAATHDDLTTAFLAATSIENELSHFRKFIPSIPSIFAGYQSSVTTLLESSKTTEVAMLNQIKEWKVDIRSYKTIEDVITYLKA